MNNTHVLPDSRLANPTGTVLVDWPLSDGSTVRIEVERVFCANCGKLFGFVPKENTVFTCWLCAKCFETYGLIAGTYAQPDDEFCQVVAAEMQERFGKTLTEAEIGLLKEDGRLGTALQLLEKESPYPALDNRPKR